MSNENTLNLTLPKSIWNNLIEGTDIDYDGLPMMIKDGDFIFLDMEGNMNMLLAYSYGNTIDFN